MYLATCNNIQSEKEANCQEKNGIRADIQTYIHYTLWQWHDDFILSFFIPFVELRFCVFWQSDQLFIYMIYISKEVIHVHILLDMNGVKIFMSFFSRDKRWIFQSIVMACWVVLLLLQSHSTKSWFQWISSLCWRLTSF